MPWDSNIPEGQKSLGLNSSLAAVLDVITNEEHEDYSTTGFNVGTIRFKYVGWGGHLDSADNSFYASSLDVDVQSYPLVGEIVVIQKVMGIPFYSRRININNKLQYNSFSNILSNLNPARTSQDKNRNTAEAKENVMQHTAVEPTEHFENKNYQEKESLHILKHFDGDVIIQNRYGATLRFGSSQLEKALNQQVVPIDDHRLKLGPTKEKGLDTPNNDPIIIMRVGERDTPKTSTTSSLGLIVEDINLDSTSFVLSSNQTINFHLASTDLPVHFRSSKRLGKDFPPLGQTDPNSNLTTTPLQGNQSLLNSDRLLFNSKTDNIILSSGQDLISLTNRDTILDTGNHFVIGGKEIHLLSDASEGEAEFTVALAEKVMHVLQDIVDTLNNKKGPAYTSTAPGGPLTPVAVAALYARASTDILDIASDLVKIEK
jgi:hypothetical protein